MTMISVDAVPLSKRPLHIGTLLHQLFSSTQLNPDLSCPSPFPTQINFQLSSTIFFFEQEQEQERGTA